MKLLCLIKHKWDIDYVFTRKCKRCGKQQQRMQVCKMSIFTGIATYTWKWM